VAKPQRRRSSRESKRGRGAPGPRTPGCGDCDSALSLLGHRFRVSTVTVVRRHGPYRGSPRPRPPGYRSAGAERSSHRFGHTHCPNSSFAPVSSRSPNSLVCICTAGFGVRLAGEHDWVARAGEAAVPHRRARRRPQVVEAVFAKVSAIRAAARPAARLSSHRGGPLTFDQYAAKDLSGGGLRDLLDDFDRAQLLVGGDVLSDKSGHFLGRD